jgi:hypothetical protein
MDKLISPSDLRAEAQRLIESGEMPSLERLLAAVAHTREKYREKMIAARRLGTDEEDQMKDPFISVLKHFGAPENRDDYLDLAYAGEPPVDSDGELPAELEAELPRKFQRAALDENVITEEKQ